MFYSVFTNGFYDPEFHGSSIPEDAVEITAEVHAALLAAQSAGKVIGVGPQGYPIATDPAPPPAASAVPEFVTMAQARLELLAKGHLSAIQQAIAAMPGTAGDVARIEWEFRPTVRRDSGLVALMAQGLGLTSAQADQMFINAAAR